MLGSDSIKKRSFDRPLYKSSMYLTLAPSLACAVPSLAIKVLIFRAPTSLDLQFRTNLVGSPAAHPTSLKRRLVGILTLDKPFDVDHSGLGTTGAGGLSKRCLVEFIQTQPLPTIAPSGIC